MTIHLTPEITIQDINNTFSKHFPYLKIEFIANAKTHKPGVNRPVFCKHDIRIGSLSKKLSSVNVPLEITSQITVLELEQMFFDVYGLTAQVFRNSSGAWLETTATDGWTLEKQNEYGDILNSKDKDNEIEEFDNDALK